MQFLYVTLLLSAISTPLASLSQRDSTYILGIEAYVDKVDTIESRIHDHLDQGASRWKESIAEGPIIMTTTQITHNPTTGKNDTAFIHKEMGGISIYTLSSANEDTLLMVGSHDNSTDNLYESYYYRHDTLICAKISLEDDGTGKVWYQRIECYKEGKIYLGRTPVDSLSTSLRYRISFSWLDKGNEYLKKFKAQH